MKRIVVLGAGFGGLRAAILIAKKLRARNLLSRYEVVLVDRNEHHTYTPLLYEVATTSKEIADVTRLHSVATYPIRTIVAHLPVTFLRAEVESLDLTRGHLHVKDAPPLQWDGLVLALGAETNYFDIPGLRERALALKTFTDAIRIRDAVSNLVMTGARVVRIVVGGAGSTGVELAGELMTWSGNRKSECGALLDVTLLEAAPSILPGFDERVVKKVKDRLAFLGVSVVENEAIREAKSDRVLLTSGREMPFDVFIWTGGVKAPALFSKLPLKTEARGRIEVVGQMECLPQTKDLNLYSKIYALGDSICFYDPRTKKQIPGVARAAISQANIAAYNILEDIKTDFNPSYRPFHKTYQPMEYPYIIPVGGKYAVAKLGPIVLSGLAGWILKGLVELNYLLSVMPVMRAVSVWLKGLRIFVQNDRLG